MRLIATAVMALVFAQEAPKAATATGKKVASTSSVATFVVW